MNTESPTCGQGNRSIANQRVQYPTESESSWPKNPSAQFHFSGRGRSVRCCESPVVSGSRQFPTANLMNSKKVALTRGSDRRSSPGLSESQNQALPSMPPDAIPSLAACPLLRPQTSPAVRLRTLVRPRARLPPPSRRRRTRVQIR